jgi:hypothetical protein
MQQYEIRHGSRVVVISESSPTHFAARLYVNNGETATLTCWKGKTKHGAERWAQKIVQPNT